MPIVISESDDDSDGSCSVSSYYSDLSVSEFSDDETMSMRLQKMK